MHIDTYLTENDILGRDFAKQIGVPAPLLSQWRTGSRPVPIERCVTIETATKGAVTRKDLRPDDWHQIWPELAKGKAA